MKLLNENEAPAYDLINPKGSGQVILVCDHASSRVPQVLSNLGLTEVQLNDHIGYDAGAAELARELSSLLDAPLILANYSRLVIDCNRNLACEASIPEISDGITVPGNIKLDIQQRVQRQEEIFHAYHDAVARLLEARLQNHPVMISIHSFTPILQGKRRPWSVGVCYGKDRRLADLFLTELRGKLGSRIGDNQPYSIEAEVDFTLPHHAGKRGLPHVMFELSCDQLRTADSVTRWAHRLAHAWKQVEPKWRNT